MRGVQYGSRNLADQTCPANEEHELSQLGTPPSTTAPIPRTTAAGSSNQRRWRIGKCRPPHVHHVPMNAARDHLANERVFLAYVRTASALANVAVVMLQLFRLKHNISPDRLTDYDLGVPVATVTLFLAMAIVLSGVWRFFACQNSMALKSQIVTSGNVVLVFIPVLILVGVAIPLSSLMTFC